MFIWSILVHRQSQVKDITYFLAKWRISRKNFQNRRVFIINFEISRNLFIFITSTDAMEWLISSMLVSACQGMTELWIFRVAYITLKGPPTISMSNIHCKKRLMIFPSLIGMSLTKLSLGRNNWIIPVWGEFGQWHPGWGRENWKPFFTGYMYLTSWLGRGLRPLGPPWYK